jgi:hypothetical protein
VNSNRVHAIALRFFNQVGGRGEQVNVVVTVNVRDHLRLMVHEIRPSFVAGHGAGQRAGAARELYKHLIAFGYGEADCEVFNYWQPNDPVRISNDAQVKSLLLQRGDELLLLLCTWNSNPEEITVALPIPASRCVDAETGEAVALDVGKLRLQLEGYGVRLLRIGGQDSFQK